MVGSNLTTAELWSRELAPTLHQMLDQSDYPEDIKTAHMNLFINKVCPTFGPHPSTKPSTSPFKSYMNDDHTPIELSWSWSASGSPLPKVRYSVEPIGELAGTPEDPSNMLAPDDFIKKLKSQGVQVDLQFYEHFSAVLAPTKKPFAKLPEENYPTDRSSKFIAIEVSRSGALSLKAYFMLHTPQLDTITHAIQTLPSADPPLLTALSNLQTSLTTLPFAPALQTPMLAVDCTHPSAARIKLYLRTSSTSFTSVLTMLQLPGVPLSPGNISTLRDFYYTILGLQNDFPDDESLPGSTHRTAGMIYHYDLRLGSEKAKVKLYIPVKHYGGDDWGVASRFSGWLEGRGKGVRGMSYVEAVEGMCTHRKLQDGLGFQTYISATFDSDELSVTSYLQPEMYHPQRRW